MRTYLAKKRVRLIREQIKYRRLYAAVILIQSQFRCRTTFNEVQVLARCARGRAVRSFNAYSGLCARKVKILRLQRDKHRAARMIKKIVEVVKGDGYNEFNQVRIKTMPPSR